jgi:outer membrane protein assembly factor BamB
VTKWTTVALALACAGLSRAAEDPSADLLAAARKGDLAAVRKHLDSGADPNARTEYGASALHFAADRGHLDVVRLLLDRKADPNAKDTFYSATPLTWAVMRGHPKVVGALIDGGATGAEGMLVSAARTGAVELVKVLLEKAKPKPETLTAALRASTKDEVTELLKKAGAKPPEPGKTPDKLDDLTAYAGTYKNPDVGEWKLTPKDGALGVEVNGQRIMFLTRDAGEKFKVEGDTSTVTFTRSAAKVTGFDFAVEKRPVRTFTRVEPNATANGAKKPSVDAPDPVPDVKAPANWPQFRGSGAAGVADGQFPPTNFDVPKGKNVRWKTPIAGLGHSGPVVWGDRVFLTTAVGNPKATLKPGIYGDVDPVKEDTELEWHVLCLDKKTGKVLWDIIACRGVPKVKRHPKGTHANATAATDGTRLVVNFGAEGLYCYDFDGKQLWKRDLGKLDSGWFYDPDYEWGFGSSPVVWKGRCFVQCDAGKNSFLGAFALTDGSEVWKVARDEPPSWGTPTVIDGPDRAELVATGTKFARGYDPETGKELWRVGRLSEISVPTPFLCEGRIVVCSGYRPVQADLRHQARGFGGHLSEIRRDDVVGRGVVDADRRLVPADPGGVQGSPVRAVEQRVPGVLRHEDREAAVQRAGRRVQLHRVAGGGGRAHLLRQ